MPQYIYAHTADELYVNLFVPGTAQIGLNGGNVQVSQQNDYPWQGNISITLTPDSAMSFELKIRMPGWAVEQPVPSDLYTFAQPAGVSNVLRVNGAVTPISLTDGYISLTRQWSPGDQVTLDLPRRRQKIELGIEAHAVEQLADDRAEEQPPRGQIRQRQPQDCGQREPGTDAEQGQERRRSVAKGVECQSDSSDDQKGERLAQGDGHEKRGGE